MSGGTAAINKTTFKLSKAGSTNKVGTAVAYNAASQKAVLDLNNNLAAGTKYKAVVTIGARDLAGNTLDQKPNEGGQPAEGMDVHHQGLGRASGARRVGARGSTPSCCLYSP